MSKILGVPPFSPPRYHWQKKFWSLRGPLMPPLVLPSQFKHCSNRCVTGCHCTVSRDPHARLTTYFIMGTIRSCFISQRFSVPTWQESKRTLEIVSPLCLRVYACDRHREPISHSVSLTGLFGFTWITQGPLICLHSLWALWAFPDPLPPTTHWAWLNESS